MVWLPTDGNNTPDFLTPLDAETDVPVYTGFNVTLDGPFNEYLTLDTQDPQGISITDIYRMIFAGAMDRGVKTLPGRRRGRHLGRYCRPCQFRHQKGTGCRDCTAQGSLDHGPRPVRSMDGFRYQHVL